MDFKMDNSIVRANLMLHPGYSPYCGADNCTNAMPRTLFDTKLNQFTCQCGWISQFPEDFIRKYKSKWKII
jgi:hypothetical protein